jgi:lysophospholipase L1-like esterase
MMKRFVLYLCKCFLAGVIALVLLSLISAVYFNPPIAVEQTDGSTNFKYIPNSKWSYMWEGFGKGKIDDAGYNNSYEADVSDPDIVFAGSSHMEALQVPDDANCVYLLNEMLDQDDIATNDYQCLNIGISGHFFETTASNYQYIAKKFRGAKYVIIEVFDAKYSPDVLDQIIEDQFHAPMEKKGALHTTLQKNPFVRLMYKKLNETMATQNTSANPDGEGAVSANQESLIQDYSEKMNTILAEIAETSAENEIIPIILMHERFWLNDDGDIVMGMDETYKKAFLECCETNQIQVIDVSSDMVNEYKENFAFSYGFSNSAPGEGHLNETGHRVIAEAVYQCINEIEAIK